MLNVAAPGIVGIIGDMKKDYVLLGALLACVGLLIFEVEYVKQRPAPSEEVVGEIIMCLKTAPAHPLSIQTSLANVSLQISPATFLEALRYARVELPGNARTLDLLVQSVQEAMIKNEAVDGKKIFDDVSRSASALTIHRTITTLIDTGQVAVYDAKKHAVISAVMKMQSGNPALGVRWTVQYSLGKNAVLWDEHYSL